MMALLLCTGFIVTQPISVMAEEIMIFAQTAQQQKQSVSGVIKDATGEPVIGASVLEKGTTNGTITDFDGRFTLNVIPGTTLIISYIGYKTIEMKTVAGQPINLTLIEDSEMLEEVVVVGYGTMRKKDLTGSVVQINPSKIADQNPTSVQDVLRGTPGLQIGYDASAKGSDASILLRGQNSLGTNASPMIVLDGMAFYGELSEINPDDIAQIDVLKDASSAAIYGAKAAAGVIIITTKKGKEGKPVINVGANLSVSRKSDYRDYFDAAGYLKFHQDWRKMYYTYGQGEDGLYDYYQAKDGSGNLLYPAGYYDDPRTLTEAEQKAWASNIGVSGIGLSEGESMLGLFARRLEFNNSPMMMENFLNGRMVDWNDATFRTGFNQDYNASISGATVLEKGTTNGTITDFDGRFTLNVIPGTTLIISYIGYKTIEMKTVAGQPINLTLIEDSEMLEEVVVVGYGTMRKKDLTGSVVQINPSKIADQNPTSVQDVLRGTPGLQIGYDASAKGSDASILLRGQNSLGTNASPMIVLDGMAFYGELSEINPDDIAQIDVLKDASSAAIYGAKAAAGVIIITTKKGKEGKPVINVGANLSVSRKSDYRDYFDAAGYLKFHQDWRKMYYTYGQGEDGLYDYYQAKDGSGNLLYPAGYYDDPRTLTEAEQKAWASNIGVSGIGLSEGESMLGLFARRLEFNNSPMMMENFLNGRMVDWNDATFRTGFNQDYNASISGATERVNYYFSLGYINNEGAVQGNEYNAFRSNMKINAKITDWLEVGANVNFQDRSDGDIQVSLGSNYWDNNMLRNSPYASMYDNNGNYEQYPMSGLPTNGGYNYYFDRQYYDLEKGYTVLNTIFNAKITLPAGFSYQFNIAPRYQWFYDRYWMSADLPNASAADRGVNRGWSKNFDWNLNNTITWDKIFGEHHFTATLVQEAEEHRYWSDNVNARNITPSDALGFHYTQGANKTQSGFSTNDTHYTAASYLGRLFYSFKDRYMFTGTFRRDGYSGFGSNNPWGNFGSVGLSWVFSEENFMSDAHDWMDMGKLRLSWGTNGNREFGDVYSTLSNLSLAGGSMVYYQNGNSNVVNPLYMSRLAAPNLEWEKTKAWNIGLDFSFLNGRLTANMDYYLKKTTDMIMSQRLPSFSGFGSIMANLGEVQNQGFEIALNSTNIQNRNFTWNTSVGFSINKNKINHIYYDYDENGVEKDDTSNGWFIGQAIGTIWYYETDGVWQNTPEDIASAALVGQKPGDPKVVNHYTEDDRILEDGTRIPVYNDNDKVYQGTTAPPVYWNLRNDFTLWKDLTLSVSLYSYMGHKSRAGYWLNQENGGSQVTNGFNVAARKYWTPDNPTNDYCRLNAAGPNTGLANGVDKVYNRSFVRLDDITLGYTLPQKWTRKFMIDRIRLTASCKNVCTFDNWEYGDPETGGLATRTFNFGINVTL